MDFLLFVKANKKVLFECHQVSKFVNSLKSVQNKKLIIFTNEILKRIQNKKNFEKNLLVLHNGYNDYFEEETKFKRKKLFLLKLLRFEKTEILNF